MRSLSFVDCLQFRDLCTSTSRNLCLYDVDNDGDNELIVGLWDSGPILENGEPDAAHITGSIYVVKGHKLWKANHQLGMILCVTAGTVTDAGVPWILALCADSGCYVFDALSDANEPLIHREHHSVCGVKNQTKEKLQLLPLKMIHNQLLAFNARDVCLIESGGAHDMAVAYSDRVVRLYTWCPAEKAPSDSSNRGKFVILIKWELAGQVNRIATHWTPKFETMLIASQPGGGFAVLQRKFEKYNDLIVPTLVYYPPCVANTRNAEARTWIAGNVRGKPPATVSQSSFRSLDNASEDDQHIAPTISSIMAVCTADGTVMLVDPTADDKKRVLWCAQLHVRGELFGLSKFNLTKGETDEVCACAWDGTTYVFNDRRELFRFQLGQSCQAFTAGWFAVEPGRNEPVLVYVTCDHNLLVYYNLNVDHLVEHSLYDELCHREDLVAKLRRLNVDILNRAEVQKTIRYLLYEHPKSTKTDCNTDHCLP
ncbi:unnamed protein product [Calicophoron daubneyi]|uniref:Integrin-alpha FG-GAP repeat-containing protein 2 n=1 Tax=Calicophoron daubneyi TaxID=300641 RepID=A0AAV2TDI6_CALDB